MDESRSKRIKRFAEMFSMSRCKANKSQEWMSLELGISRKTVQNWENGISSPDFFESLEWFRVLNTNPFPYFLKFVHPDTIKGIKPSDSDEKIEEAFNDLSKNLSIADKRAFLYLYNGDHGSSPYSVMQLMLAHLHSPITARLSNAILTAGNYDVHRHLDTLICKDNIQPDMGNLHEAIKKAEYALLNHAEGYTNYTDL